ncbi:response regulator [Herbaspirillum sp. RTI4]|uniref:response regulator n=1 Tax=Herbaspirillum sp. RTI4 TaxID=3048640 RepID=UPI002AB5878A|nr:response regulator [Herbaspirillum sp. RTI4]MDY7579155.1 response regulator [Herbaspirillum sp. RTI4]MEA9981266.1 response regulator [Herbaspirillum sp. RTI4]
MAHILIVEDDIQFREMMVKMLEGDKHKVTMANDGFDALQKLTTLQPDLIITDILMPTIDGVEFIMQLNEQGSHIPLIAMSGGRRAISPEFNLDSASLLGVKSTLAKPFSRADLRLAIENALA